MQRRVAEAKPTAPTNLNRTPWFPKQTRPRRTQCGVGADESFVTSAECARARIPVAPLPCADHGAHLAGASSRFLCLSFFAAAKKVSAAPHRGNTNRPLTKQGKAPRPEQGNPNTPSKQKPNRRAGKETLRHPPPPQPPHREQTQNHNRKRQNRSHRPKRINDRRRHRRGKPLQFEWQGILIPNRLRGTRNLIP